MHKLPEASSLIFSEEPSLLVHLKNPVAEVLLNSAPPPAPTAKDNISFDNAPVPKVNLAPLTVAIPIPTFPAKVAFPEPDIVNRFSGVAPVIKLISLPAEDLDWKFKEPAK